ncbi:hypothetical protein PybrP1_002440 [[Pythium] brassicae (nom. inval.)]|nr:hypothetical protein PybrP1_002440 [[Pythium] brassicae (nom. inval.)]
MAALLLLALQTLLLLLATHAQPTSTPAPVADDCSPCCNAAASASSSSSSSLALECCSSLPRDLFGTKNGECSGLPCCNYNGRDAQNRLAWYPCVVFPTCQNDAAKANEFCGAAALKSFTGGANFTCTDECCAGPVLESNVWTGEKNAIPGQLDATFSMTFSPRDFLRVFYPPPAPAKTLVQIMLASPRGYRFSPNATCVLTKTGGSTAAVPAAATATKCVVSTFANRSHLTVDLPVAFRSTDAFRVTFDHVATPSGVDDSTVSTSYSTERNLAPVYFIFDDREGAVFNSFYRVSDLGLAALSSGAFLPENIYPGNTGNATLAFYTNARVPRGSTIELKFAPKWKFTAEAVWSYETFPDTNDGTDTDTDDSDSTSTSANNSTRSLEAAASSDGSHEMPGGPAVVTAVAVAGPVSTRFLQTTYTLKDNWWSLAVEADIEAGWISLSVDKVQNPSVSYSGLNFATIEIRDPARRLVVDGRFSAISVDMISGASASPYNYVTMVVLTCTLLFCTVVIRSNGLAFSLGSIWTDITAICTVLALCTAILNNVVWALVRSSSYFYIARLYLCFTFTMLLAVCFHWGTVLNLRLRKLPKKTTSLAFAALNALFYGFQASFLIYHRDLVSRVYATEQDTRSYANQQCKDDAFEPSGSVFSDIQGYLWSCYAVDDERFFLVSTTVTYALFLALTLTVMLLGVLVMRRGKLLLVNATGPHQIVLMKALRLYYALIGVVTLVYLLSWVVQILSRSNRYIPYPWFYIFTVWLPCSIPPSCLIFLQWNATAQSLGDADRGSSSSSPLSQFGYGEIRTPLFSFSSADRWSDGGGGSAGDDFDDLDDDDDAVVGGGGVGGAASDKFAAPPGSADDYVGLSMVLEMNESFAQGCFIATQRLDVDVRSKASVWKQIGNTDTVQSVRKDSGGGGSGSGRFVYTFFAVPRIPVSAADERVRMVVYALSADAPASPAGARQDHSEITADAVIAALERRSTGPREDEAGGGSHSGDGAAAFHSQRTNGSSSHAEMERSGLLSSQAIDDLFENESEGESSEESLAGAASFTVVGEFTVTTSALVTAGARCEQVSLTAAEHSYRPMGPSAAPPKLSIHTVIPKAAGAKYGFTAGISGLAASHSISSQYHIREQGLLVVEDLTESRFSNLIPRQILEIVIRHRSKCLLLAQHDHARLEAYDRQRQKGSDRGIYENLIQQIQDDGDLNRCREWMAQRMARTQEYIALLRRLRRQYVLRDRHKNYFKPSTEKKNAQLRFLPINLHLQEMWVGPADTFADSQRSAHSKPSTDAGDSGRACVYDIVTVGAMAAHVYKFKNGGLLGLEEQHAKLKPRAREDPGSTAAHHQNPLWTEEEQKADNLEWEIQQRMDVCFPQAVAALVTAFTRKIDLALQSTQPAAGAAMLEQLEKIGFLFNVESLVSTHGNEAGMLEDMAGAVNELRNIRFVLVDENEDDDEDDDNDSEAARAATLAFQVEEDEAKHAGAAGGEQQHESSHSGASSASSGIAGVVDVNVFTNMDDALSVGSNGSPRRGLETAAEPPSHGASASSSSLSGVGQRLLSTLIRARSHRLLGGLGGSSASSLAPASADKLFGYTHLVIRVKLRSSSRVKLSDHLRQGGAVKVCPVLFSQGINEKQTLANNTGSSVTRLQDVINENSLRSLRAYCDRYCNYQATLQSRYYTGSAARGAATAVSSLFRDAPARDEVTRILSQLDKLISLSRQTRKKRPEILQLSSDLCRRIGAGRVTVCKSAKDRTGMSVTLEQGRILVQSHGLPEAKKAGIVAVMRSEGVRIENALKNTGRRDGRTTTTTTTTTTAASGRQASPRAKPRRIGGVYQDPQPRAGGRAEENTCRR